VEEEKTTLIEEEDAGEPGDEEGGEGEEGEGGGREEVTLAIGITCETPSSVVVTIGGGGGEGEGEKGSLFSPPSMVSFTSTP